MTAAFHPIIEAWFADRFGNATEPQQQGWPHIAAGRNTLIAAPTGSGKTLAAFLSCIDNLFRQALAGELTDGTQVVYVSPLKALSNDIHRNLEVPLAEIRERAEQAGYELPPIRTVVRTGDTPSSQRQAMVRRPPHILVTTPESLYLILTSAKAREMLIGTRTVIVDEIHALARDKRGSHLALTLERLEALCEQRPVRIGLSATQKPIEQIASFLVGDRPRKEHPSEADCEIVDVGHMRQLDLNIEVPPSELSAVCALEQWEEIYARLKELIEQHRSTLIFVNTRRLAERVAHALREVLGEDCVASHHGSLSRHIRLQAEEKLKRGELKAIVATASLEMGIDIGYIDLVCQIGSPRSIATFLQRVGRSGHALGLVPKGRLFPLTRDELLEGLSLVQAVRAGRLDSVEIPEQPLDILAQQIVAAVACESWDENDLFEVFRRAYPYRQLKHEDFTGILKLLSEGIAPNLKRGRYLHRDAINGRLKARRGARIAATTSGGAIPEMADYRVVTAEEGTLVGTVNEDFAIESMSGDIFLLGNTSWRVHFVRGGEMVVSDAQGAPATIPFWFGEAPARTTELSTEVAQLRNKLSELVGGVPEPTRDANQAAEIADQFTLGPAVDWLEDKLGVSRWAAEQAALYVAAQKAALGLVPTTDRIVFERFFDESGGMQLVIHSPLGARINRAWGYALRKRFCRSFDFELQAAADDNGIVLSLGPQHSFPIPDLFKMLNTENGEYLLVQALLAVPLFQTRWRWNVTRALAVLRFQGGRKVPPPLQRFKSEDLLAAVFPQTVGCLENQHGDIPIPDHPLVKQTVYDCLHEAMDIDRWLDVLRDVHAGEVELIARDTREPSPFAHELLNANPYAFLDDAPLEERRARAVATRRSLSIEAFRDLTKLDPDAIAQVRSEAWPIVRDADELHDTLLTMVALPEQDAGHRTELGGDPWNKYFQQLVTAGRATRVAANGSGTYWTAAERWPVLRAAWPEATCEPEVSLPAELDTEYEQSAAWVELVRGRMQFVGPVAVDRLAEDLHLEPSQVEASLTALEGEGVVMRGEFFPPQADENGNGTSGEQWCDRRLLARIHRLTLDGLRRQIEPVWPRDYLRFLTRHQKLLPKYRWTGPAGVREAVEFLQGYEVAAGAWEDALLSARVEKYNPNWLDELAVSGELVWGRLRPPKRNEEDGPSMASLTRTVPITLGLREDLGWLLPLGRSSAESFVRSNAELVLEALADKGALFLADLRAVTGLLPAHLDEALKELAALGLVTSDAFSAIRSILSANKSQRMRRGRRRRSGRPLASGRWSHFPGPVMEPSLDEYLENWAWQLLKRYGVIFRDLLAREAAAPSWYQLVPVFRRLELRGEIRGGRFVRDVAGEQYATSGAVELLRQVRDQEPTGEWLVVSACDPLNLYGILTRDSRVPAMGSNALILRDGEYIATQQGGDIQFHTQLSAQETLEMTRALRQGRMPRAVETAS